MKQITIQAPSNIALIKYWGKSDPKTQWPANSSLSMTLKSCVTVTKVSESWSGCDEIFFHGHQLSLKGDVFAQKVVKHLDMLRELCDQAPFLKIETENHFPKDCGIASSASGMAALTLGAVAFFVKAQNFQELQAYGYSLDYLSRLSRLGSGSASRSLYGGFVLWQRGLNHYSQKIEPLFSEQHWPLHNGIVLVDTQSKTVGSSEGHARASTSLLFEPRVAGIEEKITRITKAIARKDFEEFGLIVEEDALSMHGVMLSCEKKLTYMNQDTSQVLAWLRQKRQKGHIWAYGTIDAGPNVHILVQEQDRKNLQQHLAADFPQYSVLWDQIGPGPLM